MGSFGTTNFIDMYRNFMILVPFDSPNKGLQNGTKIAKFRYTSIKLVVPKLLHRYSAPLSFCSNHNSLSVVQDPQDARCVITMFVDGEGEHGRQGDPQLLSPIRVEIQKHARHCTEPDQHDIPQGPNASSAG